MKKTSKLALVLITTLMLLGLVRLNGQQNDLQWQVHVGRQDRQDYMQLDLRHTKLKREVARAWDERDAARRELLSWLADSTSRDDFIVREGPWIVASELRPGKSQMKRIGFYVPAGKHALNLATRRCRQGDHLPSHTAKAFFQEDVRRLSDVVTRGLENTPQVFELQLEVIDKTVPPLLRMRLLGKDNGVEEEQLIPLPNRSKNLDQNHRRLLPLIVYPSEFDMTQLKWELSLRRGTPTTELYHLTSKGEGDEQLAIRIWLSSSAPWCLSALYVAHNVESLSTVVTRSATLGAYRFDDLFEPYVADSGRYQFRASLLSPLVDLQENGTR